MRSSVQYTAPNSRRCLVTIALLLAGSAAKARVSRQHVEQQLDQSLQRFGAIAEAHSGLFLGTRVEDGITLYDLGFDTRFVSHSPSTGAFILTAADRPTGPTLFEFSISNRMPPLHNTVASTPSSQ